MIAIITAKDEENNPIRYSLGEEAQGKFKINEATGQLMLATVLDHEKDVSFYVVVGVGVVVVVVAVVVVVVVVDSLLLKSHKNEISFVVLNEKVATAGLQTFQLTQNNH